MIRYQVASLVDDIDVEVDSPPAAVLAASAPEPSSPKPARRKPSGIRFADPVREVTSQGGQKPNIVIGGLNHIECESDDGGSANSDHVDHDDIDWGPVPQNPPSFGIGADALDVASVGSNDEVGVAAGGFGGQGSGGDGDGGDRRTPGVGENPFMDDRQYETEFGERPDGPLLRCLKTVFRPVDDIGVLYAKPVTFRLSSYIARFPLVFSLLFLFLPLLFMILAVVMPGDFSRHKLDFTVLSHPIARSHNAMEAAMTEWAALRVHGRFDSNERSNPKYRLTVQFTARTNRFSVSPANASSPTPATNAGSIVASNGSTSPSTTFNMFQPQYLRWIQSVEREIFQTRHYSTLCWTNNKKQQKENKFYPGCVPLNSVTTYFFPGELQTTQTGYVEFEFSGQGSDVQSPISQMLRTFIQNNQFRWFADKGMSATNMQTSILRTQVTLGYPVYRNGVALTLNQYNSLVDEFVLDFVARMSAVDTHAEIEVTLGGDRVTEALVGSVLHTQVQLTIIGVAVVYAVLFIHMKNFALPALAGTQLVLSYLSAYFIYGQTMKDKTRMPLMSALLLMVTLTLNVDSVLIVYESWLQTGLKGPASQRRTSMSLAARVTHMYRVSVPGILTSHLTSFAVFVAGALSPVPAVRGFSVMMMIALVVDMYMFLAVFPCSVVFYTVYFGNRPLNLVRENRQLPLLEKRKGRHQDLTSLLASEEATKRMFGELTTAETKEIVACGGHYVNVSLDPHDLAMGRSMSMSMSMAASLPRATGDSPGGSPGSPPAALGPNGQSGPQKTTYVSERMVPLIALFQVNPQFMRMNDSVGTVGSAISSYHRRLVKQGDTATGQDFPAPAVIGENGRDIENPTTEADILTYRVKWDFIGRFLNTVRGDDYSSILTEQVCNVSMGHTCFHREKSAFGSKLVAPTTLDEPPNWRERLAAAIAVSFEDRELVRTNMLVRHQGKGYGVQIAFNFVAPVLDRLRFVFAGLGLVLFVTALLFAALSLRPESTAPTVVEATQPVNRHTQYTDEFAVQGHCDFCSAYQQPADQFPLFSLIALQQCVAQGFMMQMHAVLDVCGRCFGNSSCLDCESRPNGASTYDQCGACLHSLSPQRGLCMSCNENGPSTAPACWPCYKQNSALIYWGGPGCAVFCSPTTCPPSRGTCNRFTGECACHESYTLGFFANDPAVSGVSVTDASQRRYCTVCVSGFSPPPNGDGIGACTMECTGANSNAKCACFGGRCTGCGPAEMGPQCSVFRRSACVRGVLDTSPTGGGMCTCPTTTDPISGATVRLYDADSCSRHRDCSYHGFKYPAFEVSAASGVADVCQCAGQWRGPNCQFCRCLNGGYCTGNGTCVCPGAWTGFDCSYCDDICGKRGTCPIPLGVRQYDAITCPAVFCNATNMANCTVCNTRAAEVCPRLTQTQCQRDGGCLWVLTLRLSRVLEELQLPNVSTNATLAPTPIPTPAPPPGVCVPVPIARHHRVCVSATGAGCKGVFTGDRCEICPAEAIGLSCDWRGVVIGCDNVATPVGKPPKVVDRCGTCGGNGECFGCDGVMGSSKKLDACGVCGGFNDCLSSANRADRITASFTWGLAFGDDDRNGTAGQVKYDPAFDVSVVSVQRHLAAACNAILARSDLVISSLTPCVWTDFATWLSSNATVTEFGPVYGADTLRTPFTGPKRALGFLLFTFATRNNRFEELGFANAAALGNDTTLLWLRVNAAVRTPKSAARATIFETYHQFEALRAQIAGLLGYSGTVLQGSEVWVQAVAEESGLRVFKYGIGVAVVGVLIGTGVFTCSPVIALVTLFCLGGAIATGVAVLVLLGWSLGPTEQVSVLLIISYSTDQLLHMALDFHRYIPVLSCRLISGRAIRYQAMRHAWCRAGFATLTAGCAAALSSVVVLFSIITAFRRIGLAIIVANFMSVFFSTLVFPATLGVLGPAVIRKFAFVRPVMLGGVAVALAITGGIFAATGVFPKLDSGFIEV